MPTPDSGGSGATAELQLWAGQVPGVHDHKPYDECPSDCPGRLAPGTPYTVRVRKPTVAALLAEAKHIDPGLAAASLAPIGSPERDRHERIRDHYIAYGIRHALDNLGLMPDGD